MIDDELGREYGPGQYFVSYRVIELGQEDATAKSISMKYSIGPEYSKLHRDHCAQTGKPCFLEDSTTIPGRRAPLGGDMLSSLLKEENLKGIVLLLGVVKEVLGSGSNDLKAMLADSHKLIGQMAGNNGGNQQNKLTDILVKASVDKLLETPKSAAAQLKEQMDLFGQMKEIAAPFSIQTSNEENEDVKENTPGPFGKYIDMALPYIGSFLERFNGDESRAAAQLKKEQPIINVLLKNGEARRAFYNALVVSEGVESANRWVVGLGLNPSEFVKVQPTNAAPQRPAKRVIDLSGAMSL
jgi:hypothetical protein